MSPLIVCLLEGTVIEAFRPCTRVLPVRLSKSSPRIARLKLQKKFAPLIVLSDRPGLPGAIDGGSLGIVFWSGPSVTGNNQRFGTAMRAEHAGY